MYKSALRITSFINASFFCALISTIGYVLSYFIDFDTGIRYFNSGIIHNISVSLLLASIAVMIISPFFIPKLPTDKKVDFNMRSSVASILPIITFLIIIGFSVAGFITGNNDNTKTLTLLTVIISALSLPYYIMLLVGITPSHDLLPLAGFMPVISGAFIIAETYFDNTIEMNSPEKVMVELATVGFMLFTTCELRYLLGKGSPRQTTVFGTCALIISAVTYIPCFIAHVSGLLLNPGYMKFELGGIFIMLYIAMRLIGFRRAICAAAEPEQASEGTDSASDNTDNNIGHDGV